MKPQLAPKPDLERRQRVTVTEEGIRPWQGQVLSVKPSSVSGWWIEVQRDDGAVFAIAAARVA